MVKHWWPAPEAGEIVWCHSGVQLKSSSDRHFDIKLADSRCLRSMSIDLQQTFSGFALTARNSAFAVIGSVWSNFGSGP